MYEELYRCYVRKYLLVNSLPEPVLRYASKLRAISSVLKAKYASISHGVNFEVWEHFPALCSARRLFKSEVEPL